MNSEKSCIKCNETKPLSDFHKRSAMPDGHYNTCKLCRKPESERYYLSNKDIINEKNRNYNLIHKEEKVMWDKAYYVSNSKSLLEKNKEYRKENRLEIKTQRKGYYNDNVDKIAEYKKEYYQTPNGKLSRKRGNRKRRAMKLSQYHPSNIKDIENQLELIRERVENCLGIKHVLDHVWPLSQGGLHHVSNLRIVPSSINQRKHNDMTFEHPSITMWYDLPEWLIYDTIHWNKLPNSL